MGFLLLGASLAAGQGESAAKHTSVFFPRPVVERARANAEKHPWAAEMQSKIIDAAQPWLEFTDDELWSLMFGNTIKRSWMVWSDGYCPACQKNVPMYNWRTDALGRPWKVWCPHCGEIFPKNDFHKFYLSGLDEHAVFDPARADRSLLFNTDHPGADDPLHLFGVDDGEGYVDGDKRWRFIGAYLVYGQWYQAVLNGIRNLASAYAVTGDARYAHKAGVLLDRVADLYPTFDFLKQGVLYDSRSTGAGYVTVWHNACEDTRFLAMAYDQIFDAIAEDKELVAFLARKAEQFRLANAKATFADIQRNIEDGILLDAVRNRRKITSNYPRTDFTVAVIKTVLGWPASRDEVYGILDGVLQKGTAVDGVTGEKGLAGYSASAVRAMVELLAQFSAVDPGLLEDMMKRHPKLRLLPRFHIDTLCLGKYYPLSGDTGAIAQPVGGYVISLSPGMAGVTPSGHSLFWRLYELTGDVAFVQVLYQANGRSVEGLPHEISADDPAAMQRAVQDVIERDGPELRLGSVNKQEWHLAILRSGEGDHERALWLDYDSGGGHGHADGMNLGLFAKGLDLMPDFGYPPVQFGGWGSPRARWYINSTSHNTVVVDGDNISGGAGVTTLWADGAQFRAIRASGPGMNNGQRFERTAALIDISDRDSYVLDIFRVAGGSDHAKFMHSQFGEATARGLTLTPCEDYGHGAIMRNFACDSKPQPGWSVDWDIEDRYRLLQPEADVHFRCTDLTTDAQAVVAEAWAVAGIFGSSEEVWIPRIITRRQAQEAPLSSTFVAIVEPYEGRSNIAEIRRVGLKTEAGTACPDSHVAVEIRLADGRRDLLAATDPESETGDCVTQDDWRLHTDAELCLVRMNPDGAVARIAACQASEVSIGDTTVRLKQRADFLEVSLAQDRAVIESGDPDSVDTIIIGGRERRWEGR